MTEDRRSVWLVENCGLEWEVQGTGLSQSFSQDFTQFDGHCFHLGVLSQGILSTERTETTHKAG